MRRTIRAGALALTGAIALACQHDAPAPAAPPADGIQGIQIATDAYVAYQHSDCETVYRLTQPEVIDGLEATELRHSLRLARGFCQEIDGDVPAARATYHQVIDDARSSFAAADARERLDVLDRLAKDPDFAPRVEEAARRAKQPTSTREPSERTSALYPPLARAAGVEGFAVVEFGVTRSGKTVEPIVVASDPPYLFEGSALRAVRSWQYKSQRSADRDDRQVIRIVFRSASDPVTLEDGATSESAEAAPQAP